MFAEDTQGFTELAHQTSRYDGDSKLSVHFHVLPMLDQDESAREGRPKFRDVEHIRILVPGNKESIIDRPVSEMDRARFREKYENWRAGRAELISGTTLEAARQDKTNPHLQDLTASQIEEMRYFNVRTVEQLESVSDANAQKFMGLNLLRDKARKYLEVAKEHAGETWAKAELAKRDNEIDSLKKAIEEQARMIQDLQHKRSPGRPPKVNVG